MEHSHVSLQKRQFINDYLLPIHHTPSVNVSLVALLYRYSMFRSKTTPTRIIPHQDNSPPGLLPTWIILHQDNSPPGLLPTWIIPHQDNSTLGQLPTWKSSHKDNFPQGQFPTRTTPLQDNSPLYSPPWQLPTRTIPHKDNSPPGKSSLGQLLTCLGGESS